MYWAGRDGPLLMLLANRFEVSDNPRLKELQGPFELTYQNIGTWVVKARHLDRIVWFFGPETHPKDIFRKDVLSFFEYIQIHDKLTRTNARAHLMTGSAWYKWMDYYGLVDLNPFYPCPPPKDRNYQYGRPTIL